MYFVDFLKSQQLSFQGKIYEQEPLSKHTYYRIGGAVRELLIPYGLEDLHILSAYLKHVTHPIWKMGQGSNILAPDEPLEGTVIRWNQLHRSVLFEQQGILTTGAGLMNSSVLHYCGKVGLDGLQFLVGVPGCVGGAVFMNAGTHLGEVKDALLSVQVFSLKDCSVRMVECSRDDFQYRSHKFLDPDDVILQAAWKVTAADPQVIKQQITDLLATRKKNQPIEYPSCGSVFKNPQAQKAWQVIDALGLRGYRQGDVAFSEKHPNFIVNLGQGRAADVRVLIALAQSRAKQELGVQLDTEVIIWDSYFQEGSST